MGVGSFFFGGYRTLWLPIDVLLTCNDSQSIGGDALACQCDIIFHFLVFVLGIRVIMRAEVR